MKCSVVIPTCNRAGSLRIALDSVLRQTAPPDQYEIIVVDDGSKDQTKNAVEKIKKAFPRHTIRYFFHENKGQAAAKNTGIKHARGEIIFFTDDDCLVPQNWVETLLEGYRKYPDVAGVGGWVKPPEDENRFFQKSAYLIKKRVLAEHEYDQRPQLVKNTFHPVALVPNVSYKKPVLEKVGGFDEKISSFGSDELKYRLIKIYGEKILSVPTAVIHQCPLGTWGNLKKYFRRGRAKYYCRNKYLKLNAPSPIFELGLRNLPPLFFSLASNRPKNRFSSWSDWVKVANFLLVTSCISSWGWLYGSLLKLVDKRFAYIKEWGLL